MKTTKFALSLLLLMMSIFITPAAIAAQEFMGIPVEGKPEAVIKQLEQKGFTLEKTIPEKHYSVLSGVIASSNVTVSIVHTPISKQVWKIAVYFDDQSSWQQLKSEYTEYKEVLISKYGKPDKDYHFFSSPYDEGDGHEMTAVRVDKCNYLALWEKKGVWIRILKSGSVNINYENMVLSDLQEQEEKRQKATIF